MLCKDCERYAQVLMGIWKKQCQCLTQRPPVTCLQLNKLGLLLLVGERIQALGNHGCLSKRVLEGIYYRHMPLNDRDTFCEMHCQSYRSYIAYVLRIERQQHLVERFKARVLVVAYILISTVILGKLLHLFVSVSWIKEISTCLVLQELFVH